MPGLHQTQFGVALFRVGSKSDEVLATVKIVLGNIGIKGCLLAHSDPS